MMFQPLLVDRGPQERGALELVADEIGPFGRDDEEADEPLVVADASVPAEERLAEHRRPLDLEHHRQLAADVPDRVDLGERVDRPADAAEVGALLALVKDVAEVAAPVSAALLALGEPDPQAKAMAGVGDRRQQLGVLLAPRRRSSAVTRWSGVLARLR